MANTLRDKILTLRVAGTLAEQIKVIAKLTGQTPSDFAREILIMTVAEIMAGVDISNV